MTPEQFEGELYWMGWRALTQKAWGLRPAEAHALTLLMRCPGRVVTVETLAAYDGDGMACVRLHNGSRGGICTRLVRLRAKLADLGCNDVIETVRDGGCRGGGPAVGYRISMAGARVLDGILRGSCGLKIAEAA
jgi:hypothetical protein